MYKSSTNNFKFDQRASQRLKQCIVIIRALYQEDVKEISVFGSYSKGSHKKYSTLDLLIVVSESSKRFIERNIEIQKLLNEGDILPIIDPLVYTEAELEELKNKKESYILSVLKEAIVIWNDKETINLKHLNSKNTICSRYSIAIPKLKEVKI